MTERSTTDTAKAHERPVERAWTWQVVRGLTVGATLLVVSIAAIAFALQVAPEQSVVALGQTVRVGATPPAWSVAGPGEVVLFGQPPYPALAHRSRRRASQRVDRVARKRGAAHSRVESRAVDTSGIQQRRRSDDAHELANEEVRSAGASR
jgi:hypothetical protein